MPAVYNDPCKNGPFGQDEPSVPWNAVRIVLITAFQIFLGHSPGSWATPNWLPTHRYHRNAEVQTTKSELLPAPEANGPFLHGSL